MKFLFDLFPILLFFVAYKLYDIYIATGVAIAAAFVQTGLYWLNHRRFEKMHVITLVILILYVAFNYSEATWVNFKLFGMMGLTIAFVFIQALLLSRYMELDERKN